MKCKICSSSVEARYYGQHVKICRKIQRDLSFFAAPPREPEPKLESKCYPIGGVAVKFPYKPYPVQFQYMSKVIQALKNSNHALLESPTGTGKTLSLLCSALSWQQKVKEECEIEEARRCPVHDADTSFCPDPENDVSNGARVAGNVSDPNISVDDTEYREGKRFGRIASVKIHNPVAKKKTMERKKRSVHIFIQDVYKNLKVKRVDVQALQEENSLSLVEIDETSRRSIFVEIPKSGVAMVQKELHLKPNTKLETWVLERPANYQPPKFIDDTTHTSTPLNRSSSSASTHNSSQDDEDFVSPKKSKNSSSGAVPNEFDTYDFERSDPVKSKILEKGESGNAAAAAKLDDCCCDEIRQRKHLPKIYFCTRTHRQIAQIIRELNKTEFNQVRMSILSSREHSCVNPRLAKESNKNDKCRDLRQDKMCKYGEQSNRLASVSFLRRRGITQAWDVEELAELGRKETSCPYYASVEMAKSADIVFAPYNYILDPFIATQRELDLSGNVAIFDEGHNIEDVCRSSVGYEATQFQLGEAIANLEDVIVKDGKCLAWSEQSGVGFETQATVLIGLKLFLQSLLDWTLSFKDRLVDDYFEHSHYSLDGVNCLKQLQAIGITSDRVEQVFGWVTVLADKDKDKDSSENSPPELDFKRPKPKTGTLFLCEKFVLTYRTFAATGNAPSFSLCIKQSPLSVEDPHTHKYTRMIGITLCINCLNPAVVFKFLSSKCHSVIVTSGTLSPMDTFQSELGTEFRVQHEGKHVVPKSNFLAMNLTAGPSGHSFNAGYKNAETFKFQDDIGDVICRTCSLVPHGVLVFFPSYRLLEKVSERWHSTGLWDKILSHKIIVSEPRGSNRNAFNEAMDEFDRNVESGVLLLAVCRGKISEGVDFADNSARAVITIGLPFPNFKSTEITDKRKYNDKFCKELRLLSGQEWYTIQAFRAVNQALGRCLRHIRDWGAIIMIEARLPGNERYWKSISRWIRDEMISTENCSEAYERLEYFCHDKRGMLDQYDMNAGGFLSETSSVGNTTNNDSSVSAQDVSVSESPAPHSRYPVVDVCESPESPVSVVVSKKIPLFSNDKNSSAIQEIKPADIFVSNSSSFSENKEEVTATSEKVEAETTIEISSSPELFIEGSNENQEALESGQEDLSDIELTDEVSPPKVTSSSEDKRLRSPEETTNLVIKRRRVSRMQKHLNESSSEYQSSDTPSSSSSPSTLASTSCTRCSNRLLKTRPSSDKTVLISDFIRGRYDIRALGKLQFVAFPDENSTNSTLGNMGVFCSKCGSALGRLTFSIGDDSVDGIVQLE